MVANVVGHPFYTKKFIEAMDKTSYAKVLIKMDVSQPLLEEVKMVTPTGTLL